MKLPSLNFLAASAGNSFVRFPWSIIASFIASAIGIYLTEQRNVLNDTFPFINTMLCLGLAIPLYFCVGVFVSKFLLSSKWYWLIVFITTGLLVILYFTFPNSDDTHNTQQPYLRYVIYNITAHLLVSFLPYSRLEQLNGFWNYNKVLFLRFLTSLLYSVVLYFGLVLALVALKTLFEIDIHDELFADLAILIFGFFNTWFFMAGIPQDFEVLNLETEYPKGLRIFAQYILLPLLVLYLLILYGYGSKIVALWNWPKGIVSYLILCVSVLGIFTSLLLFPYANSPAYHWIKKATKGYYLLLIPLIVLLFIAIGFRLSDYGITINRYIILFLGVWLTIVSFYFILGKTNIRFIPMSLAIMLLLMSFGPWGMFCTSESSQVKRLETLLTNAKILVNGKINKKVAWQMNANDSTYSVEYVNEGLLTDSLHNEVKSIFDYLDTYHGFNNIASWYNFNVDSVVKQLNPKSNRWTRYSEATVYMQSVGLHSDYIYNEGNNYKQYQSIENKVVDVKGFDYMLDFNFYEFENQLHKMDKDNIYLTYYTYHKPKLQFKYKDEKQQFPLDSLLKVLRNKYMQSYNGNISNEKMRIYACTKSWKAKIEFNNISFNSDSIKPSSMSGKLFLKKK